MATGEEGMKAVAGAVLQMFKVFRMFGFKAGEDLRLGSFMHMFEEEGASRTDVDRALAYLMEKGWLQVNSSPEVRPGGFLLTTEGEAMMRKFLGEASE